MDLKAVANEQRGVSLNDYVESIESEVSEIKFFISQIYKAFTIYKDKKEEYKAEVQKLNDVINDLKEKEIKYKQEIENLNKTMQDKEKKYADQINQINQIKQLEKRLIENTERGLVSPRNRKNPQQAKANIPQLNSPDIFYEKRPYYNELNVSKIVDPFKLYRAVN
jgi:chromosome segregation ATPase